MQTPARLAAISYQSGFRIDEFLARAARTLAAEGVKLAGVIQENAEPADSGCASMALVDLATGRRFGISQDLGPTAQGCRLDPHGLAEAQVPIETSITGEVDLVILNKFGAAEAEGDGLRAAFARAAEIGVPVLTSVRPPYTEAWSEFQGGLAEDLTPELEGVLSWCRHASRRARERRAAFASSP